MSQYTAQQVHLKSRPAGMENALYLAFQYKLLLLSVLLYFLLPQEALDNHKFLSS